MLYEVCFVALFLTGIESYPPLYSKTWSCAWPILYDEFVQQNRFGIHSLLLSTYVLIQLFSDFKIRQGLIATQLIFESLNQWC